MTRLKTAVIGTGYLGEFHAQKYHQLKQTDLVAIIDIDINRAQSIAQQCQTQALTDYRELVGKVDAVSIVTPTQTHYEIGKFCLENGIHVLMEKPITETPEEAQTLIDIAAHNNLVLQVGYLERFNPILTHSMGRINQPMFLESNRIMPFNPRNKDVNVVLDLMIHDIDLIQMIVNSPIQSIDASGACVLTQKIDIANARIHFESGCVANVTASRISLKTERKMRVFQPDAYFSLDFHGKQATMCTKGIGEMLPGIPNVKRDIFKAKKADALRDEIVAFANSIIQQQPAIVPGEAGKMALQAALEITTMVHNNLNQHGFLPQ